MNIIPLESSLPVLANALEANLCAHARLYSHLPGAILLDERGVMGLMTSHDVSESCIYQACLSAEQTGQKIEQVLGRYRSQGCLPMWWIVGPATEPANLGQHLESHGFRCFAHPPGMFASLAALSRPGESPGELIITRVTTLRQLMEWVEIVQIADEISDPLAAGFVELYKSQGFGSDAPCRLFLGSVRGRPVAASRLFPAGGIAGIYHVSTLPEARGRGFGTAMTLAAAQAGTELGYQIAGLFATQAGYPLYKRLGFQEVCKLDVYLSPA